MFAELIGLARCVVVCGVVALLFLLLTVFKLLLLAGHEDHTACWKWDGGGSSPLPHRGVASSGRASSMSRCRRWTSFMSTCCYIDTLTLPQAYHMFSRLNQVARHLARPLPNYLHNSAFAGPAAMAQERSKRTINTAACLIIGDEVLGGKVSTLEFYKMIHITLARY